MLAKIEGLIERALNARFGDPTPTYAERKRMEKARDPPSKTEGASSGPSGSKLRKTARGGVKVLSVTTLNPPAKSARSAIRTLQQQQRAQITRENKIPKAVNHKPQESQTLPKEAVEVKRTDSAKDSWATVVSRKAKRREKKTEEKQETGGKKGTPDKAGTATKVTEEKKVTSNLRKEPKMAAITVTCPKGKYEEILREARNKINIEDMGIQGIKINRAITGALKFEIPGENTHKLADTLALRLKRAIGNKESVKIERPIKMAEIRIRGLDDSIKPTEIREAVAKVGKCEQEEVKLGDIQKTPSGMGMAWARCPLSAVNRIMVSDRIQIGWALTRLEMLAEHPLQCFKCLEGGHVRQRCPNKEDRSNRCYRCREAGHLAKSCEAVLKCPVCSDKNLPSNHRTGGKSCTPVQKGRRGIALNKVFYESERTKSTSRTDKEGNGENKQTGNKQIH